MISLSKNAVMGGNGEVSSMHPINLVEGLSPEKIKVKELGKNGNLAKGGFRGVKLQAQNT